MKLTKQELSSLEKGYVPYWKKERGGKPKSMYDPAREKIEEGIDSGLSTREIWKNIGKIGSTQNLGIYIRKIKNDRATRDSSEEHSEGSA